MPKEFDEIINELKLEAYKEGFAEGFREGFRQGYEEGIRQARNDIAQRLIAYGSIPLYKIAEYTELSLEEVEEIKESMDV